MVRNLILSFMWYMAWFIPLFSVICLLTLALGLFLMLKPSRAIDFQKNFYRTINWRMEPIDLALEIRNTQIMGGFSFFISLVAGANILAYSVRL